MKKIYTIIVLLGAIVLGSCSVFWMRRRISRVVPTCTIWISSMG